jgi:hypothetical protein
MFTGHPSVEETILRIQSAMKPIERRSTWAVLILGVLFFGSPSLTMGQSVSQRPECTGVLHGTVSDRDGKPVSDISVVAYPLGVDIEGLLARTNTNQAGEYRFEHVCPGTYATFPDDQKAGYEVSNVWVFEFLSAHAAQKVKLDSEHSKCEINISLFPKPAHIEVFVATSVEQRRIGQYAIWVKAPNQRHPLEYEFFISGSPARIAVPAKRYFTLEVVAKGFHKWKWRIDNRERIFLREGEEVKLNATLDPVR